MIVYVSLQHGSFGISLIRLVCNHSITFVLKGEGTRTFLLGDMLANLVFKTIWCKPKFDRLSFILGLSFFNL